MLSIRAAALTDIGRVRSENEDRFLNDQKLQLFGVADGVGGLPAGGEAAQAAIDEVCNGFRGLDAQAQPDLVKIVQASNEAVRTLGARLSPSMGIGTTLTVGCIRNGEFQVGHVGDSRCYVVAKDGFHRISEDHSVENEARLRRARGEVVYYHEANRNALTRCIGQPTPPDVDVIKRPLVAGDRYLFCTDGVTRMMPDTELGEIARRHENPELAVKEIVTLAVRRGGPDNATAVIIFIDAV